MPKFTVFRKTREFMSMLNKDSDMRMLHINALFHLDSNKIAVDKAEKSIQALFDLGHIKPAAVVECSKDDLFCITNSINHNWTENKEVTLLDGHESLFLSSSSVGDVYLDENGQVHVFAAFGTEKTNLRVS
jgi:hypothetical protein